MIRVTIDLLPFGREEEKETLHTIEIANIGNVKGNIYHYMANLDDNYFSATNHNRSESVLKLIKKIFDKAEIKKPQ